MQSQNLGTDPSKIIGGGIGDVFNFATAVGEYKRSQEQGDNGAVSLAKGIGNFAWGEFYYGGVSRIVNERGFNIGFGGKNHLISAGSVAGTTGKLVGGAVGGVVGSAASVPVGLIAKIAGKQSFSKTGSIMWNVAKGGLNAGAAVGAMAGQMGITMAVSMTPQLLAQLPKKWENNAKVMTQAYRQRGKLGSGYFEMSQAGYTMRQRSLNAIRQNGLNTQTALGNEARMYYRGAGMDD